jgi:hypothetical protein
MMELRIFSRILTATASTISRNGHWGSNARRKRMNVERDPQHRIGRTELPSVEGSPLGHVISNLAKGLGQYIVLTIVLGLFVGLILFVRYSLWNWLLPLFCS